MMKKLLSAVFCLILMTTAAMGADGVTVGYCNGQVTRTGTVGVDGDTWVSAAIRLTPEMLAPYAGSSVSAIRVGLAARTNIDEVRVWLRSSLAGDDLAQGSITTESEPAIARGWNEVELAMPYNIISGETLYVGLSYKQRGASNALSVITGAAPEGAFYFKAGDEADWTDRSSDGMLSLEAVVTGVNVAQWDVELLSAEGRFNSQGEIVVTTLVHNIGTQAVEGLTLAATVVGTGERHSMQFTGRTIESGASQSVDLTFKPEGEGVGRQLPVDIELESLAGFTGQADENLENNTVRVLFNYPRRVLVEEFTGEECTNCPRAAMFLHQALYQDGYAAATVMMAHHSGYNPDFLTFRPADIDYEWFFNSDRVYAPALMFDRVAQENSWGVMSPCVDPESAAFIGTAIAYTQQRPARAFIDLSAQLSGNQLNVSVSGGRTTSFGLTPPRLTICLVEDHIEQREQVSMSQWPEFEHMGALRAINATWGELIDWQGDLFATTTTFTLSDEWNRDNLRLVAFVHDYDADDPTRCEVENATDISLTDATGISDPRISHPLTTVVYDLQGRRLNAAGQKGLRIVRTTSPDGTVTTQKYLH